MMHSMIEYDQGILFGFCQSNSFLIFWLNYRVSGDNLEAQGRKRQEVEKEKKIGEIASLLLLLFRYTS